MVSLVAKGGKKTPDENLFKFAGLKQVLEIIGAT